MNGPDNLVTSAVTLAEAGDLEAISFSKFVGRYVVTVSLDRREDIEEE